MHGLIFETSVWLLAESTRLLSWASCVMLHKNSFKGWRLQLRRSSHFQCLHLRRNTHLASHSCFTSRSTRNLSKECLHLRRSTNLVSHSCFTLTINLPMRLWRKHHRQPLKFVSVLFNPTLGYPSHKLNRESDRSETYQQLAYLCNWLPVVDSGTSWGPFKGTHKITYLPISLTIYCFT